MSASIPPTDAAPVWERGLILRALTGSRAYGIATAESDEDSRGVCVLPERLLLGLEGFEQHESEGKDHVVYALGKFAGLALQGNPNIIETLFAPEDTLLHVDELGAELLAQRGLFLSRRAGERFGGYARGQLERMERHRRWLENPPAGPPEPAAFGATTDTGQVRFPDPARRKEFERAQTQWNHYATWRAERNEARAALERAHGYDTKHAVHLVRLLRMGEEILTRGEVIVRRPDAEELLGLRRGEWPVERVLAEARERTERLPALMAASVLPEAPDRGRVDGLVVGLHRKGFERWR